MKDHLTALLPSQPDGDEYDVITVKARFPDSNTMLRSFRFRNLFKVQNKFLIWLL